jgi:hypothetical protein
VKTSLKIKVQNVLSYYFTPLRVLLLPLPSQETEESEWGARIFAHAQNVATWKRPAFLAGAKHFNNSGTIF